MKKSELKTLIKKIIKEVQDTKNLVDPDPDEFRQRHQTGHSDIKPLKKQFRDPRSSIRQPDPNLLNYANDYDYGDVKETTDDDSLYVEYVGKRPGEDPFLLHGEKFEFCNGKYPNGKTDIAVYAYRGDVCYGYGAWRKRYNIK